MQKEKKSASAVESINLQRADRSSHQDSSTLPLRTTRLQHTHTPPRARLPLLAAPKGTLYYGSYAFYEDHHVGCGAVPLIKWRVLISSQTAIPVIRRATATRLSSPGRERYLGGSRAERLRKQSVRPGRVDGGLVHTHG